MTNPHDRFFKEVFSHKENAMDFVSSVMPEELKRNIDFSSFELEKDSYVTEELSEYFSDIVYSVDYAGKRKIKLSLLFEHKSYAVECPHIQLLRYMDKIWRYQEKQLVPRTPVLSIVLYHGKDKWTYDSLANSFGETDDILKKYIPSFDYLLCDLSGLTDEDIKNRVFVEVSLRIALLMMKHIFDEAMLRQHLSDILAIGKMYYETEKGLA